MKKQTLLFLLASICAIITSGCATEHNPLYSEVSKTGVLVPKAGKALVVVYFKPGGMGGAKVKYKIYANGELLTAKMHMTDFLTFDAAPGNLSIAATSGSGNSGTDVAGNLITLGPVLGLTMAATQKKKERLAFNLSPMETYYVRMINGFWRERMALATKEEAEMGMKDCRWLNAPGSLER